MGFTQHNTPPAAWAAIQAAVASQPAPAKARSRRVKPVLVEANFTAPGTWLVPVHVVSGDNQSGRCGFRSKIGRSGHERQAVFFVLARYHRELAPFAEAAQAGEPLRCLFTRIGRAMDSDGLSAACKYVRDAVAAMLGVTDGPRGPVRWDYDQEPGGACGVRITLERIT